MASDQKPHFVLVPFLAQGHMIPMIDMAHLIAARGALVSFITTPVNADRIRPVIDRVKDDGLPIRFVELDFPWAQAGLPEGCENIDLAIPKNLVKEVIVGIGFLREPLTIYLREVEPAPSCMIVDYFGSFTAEVARELSIPRFIFHGPSCFSILCFHKIVERKVFDDGDYKAFCDAVNEFELKPVPDLPQRIEISRAQAPGWFPWPGLDDIRDKAVKSEEEADGAVVNTLYELEPEFVDLYREVIGKPVWPLGPLSLSSKDVASKGARGNKSSIDEHQVLSWLDSMEAKSVLYVSFGSLAQSKPEQLTEIGCGLEASNRPFIWVIKETDKCAELEKWMSEGFEEKSKERSLVITGWAPQALILSHPSIGGFVTHCGWNSILEAVASGVPMATWPHFADQFLNEKLVVEILKVGVAVGAKLPVYYVKEGEVAVKRDDVEKAISSLMDGREECKARCARIADLREKAHKAMEVGGSSYENLSLLIEHAVGSSKQA